MLVVLLLILMLRQLKDSKKDILTSRKEVLMLPKELLKTKALVILRLPVWV